MATPPPTPNRFGWIWIVIIAALAILLIVWMLDPSGDADDIENVVNLPADGYVVAPTGPAVPVDLPTADPMIGAPAISPRPMETPMATPSPEQ